MCAAKERKRKAPWFSWFRRSGEPDTPAASIASAPTEAPPPASQISAVTPSSPPGPAPHELKPPSPSAYPALLPLPPLTPVQFNIEAEEPGMDISLRPTPPLASGRLDQATIQAIAAAVQAQMATSAPISSPDSMRQPKDIKTVAPTARLPTTVESWLQSLVFGDLVKACQAPDSKPIKCYYYFKVVPPPVLIKILICDVIGVDLFRLERFLGQIHNDVADVSFAMGQNTIEILVFATKGEESRFRVFNHILELGKISDLPDADSAMTAHSVPLIVNEDKAKGQEHKEIVVPAVPQFKRAEQVSRHTPSKFVAQSQQQQQQKQRQQQEQVSLSEADHLLQLAMLSRFKQVMGHSRQLLSTQSAEINAQGALLLNLSIELTFRTINLQQIREVLEVGTGRVCDAELNLHSMRLDIRMVAYNRLRSADKLVLQKRALPPDALTQMLVGERMAGLGLEQYMAPLSEKPGRGGGGGTLRPYKALMDSAAVLPSLPGSLLGEPEFIGNMVFVPPVQRGHKRPRVTEWN